MTPHEISIDNRHLIDLGIVASSSTGPGPVWTHQSDDLHINLLVFGAGDGVAEHINTELDVLVIGVEGTGSIEVDGQRHLCQPGQAVVIPKGARRAIRAVSQRFAYLACHRRRAGLWPTVAPPPSP